MKITVKSHLNRYELFKEPENRFLGQIRKQLRSGRLDVLDAKGSLTASVRQNQETLMVTNSKNETFSCLMKYREDAAGKKIPDSLIRPPMPARICFSIRQGELCLAQTPHRDFKISLNGQEISEIRHMLGVNKEIRILSDSIPETCYGIIFALAFLMLHDDDIDII